MTLPHDISIHPNGGSPVPVDPMRWTRRRFLAGSMGAVGGLALAALGDRAGGASLLPGSSSPGGAAGLPVGPHFAPRAKRIIYLVQSGGPSQLDLLDTSRCSRSATARSFPTRCVVASDSPA